MATLPNACAFSVSNTPGNSSGFVVSAVASGPYRIPRAAEDGATAFLFVREDTTWEICESTYTHSSTTWSRGTLVDSSGASVARQTFTSACMVSVVGLEASEVDGLRGLSLRRDSSGIAQAVQVDGVDWVSGSPPLPTGNLLQDHAAMVAFFDAAPEGASIRFTTGVTYEVYGGAIRHKPGQVVDYALATVKRAAEVVTTTTDAVVYGASIVIPVTSSVGFAAGQTVGIYGTISGGNAAVVWKARITSVAPTSITVDNSHQFIDLVTQSYTTSSILSGATVKTAGTLVDAASLMSTDSVHKITNLIVDGNKANNATINRWEYCCDVKVFGAAVLEDTYVHDSCGEALIVWGSGPCVSRFRAEQLNGNGVHLNEGCYDAIISDVSIDTCCLVDIGHSDGGIIASATVARSTIDRWRVVNSRKGAIGAFDSADNSHAKISNGYAEACWDGLRMSTSAALTDIELRDITLVNCGPSVVGVHRTSVSQLQQGKRWNIRNLRLVDSLITVTGLSESFCEIWCSHSDSASNTSTTTASGRATNYDAYSLGPTNALVTFSVCDNSTLIAHVYDGASAPIAWKSNIIANSQAGGPLLNCTLDFSTVGGRYGVAMQAAVVVGCSGRLAVKNWLSGDTGIRLDFGSHTVDAAFPSGVENSRDNKFDLDVEYSLATAASSTVGIRPNNNYGASTGTGWLTLSGSIRYLTSATGSTGLLIGSGTPRMTRLSELTVTGPAAGFSPFSLLAADSAGSCRVRGCATYPADASLPTNWVADDAGIVTLPA